MAQPAARPDAEPQGLSIECLTLGPGESLAPGGAWAERAVTVVEGAGLAEIDGRPVALAAGHNLRLPPGVRFGVRQAGTDGPLVLVIATSGCAAAARTEGWSDRLRARLAWALRRAARRLVP